MNEREMDLEDLITSRSGDVLRYQAYAESALPEMQEVWRRAARQAAADVARLVSLRTPETVARMGPAHGAGAAGRALVPALSGTGDRMTSSPSPTQWRVLGYLRQFHAEEDRLPTMDEIARQFGWASANAAKVE